MVASLYSPPSVVASVAELLAFDGNTVPGGTVVTTINANAGGGDQSNAPGTWRFLLASATADASGKFVLAPNVNPAGGKWFRVDQFFDLALFVQFSQADGSTLWTIPTGFRVRPTRPMLEVGTPFSGGAASTIGLSSSNAGFNTKGDLMGGAAGDAAANLLAGFRGTIGTKLAAAQPPVVLIAGDTVRWDRITSAFTAGTGVLHFPVEVLA